MSVTGRDWSESNKYRNILVYSFFENYFEKYGYFITVLHFGLHVAAHTVRNFYIETQNTLLIFGHFLQIC